MQSLYLLRPIQPYHFKADLPSRDGTFKFPTFFSKYVVLLVITSKCTFVWFSHAYLVVRDSSDFEKDRVSVVRVPLVLRCISQGHKSAIFLDHLIQLGLHTDRNMADMASCLLLQVLPHCLLYPVLSSAHM
jgi:hypothetical protein